MSEQIPLPLRPADLFRLRMEIGGRTGLPRSSGNFEAVLAAVGARGPRCETCDGWTFRPVYRVLDRTLVRQCPECRPSRWGGSGPVPAEHLAIELSYGPRRMT